jgi:formate-dependent nitrite reductase membrane component NrfD
MTSREFIRAKSRIYALIGIGIAALYVGYRFAVTPLTEATRSPAVPLIFVAIGLLCFIASALMARNLDKEKAPQ